LWFLGAVSLGSGGAAAEYAVLSKQFFFEKKNQKTFVYCGQHHSSQFGEPEGRN
jgi:hypothetical protein